MREKEYIIHLDWDGPFKFNELEKIMDDKTDYGVYQIYGAHMVYGNNVLLYIGKAEKQTFGTRLYQENWGINSDPETMRIYIGRVAGNITPAKEQWENEICLAEKLLIYSHKPAYNSQNLKNILYKDFREIHILNWGHYCDLMPEVSGARWTSKYDDMPDYEVYGDHDS